MRKILFLSILFFGIFFVSGIQAQESLDACINESSPGKNDRCPVRDQCCQSPQTGYQNRLHYIVSYCGGQYSPSMCSAVPSASVTPSVSSCVGGACVIKNPLKVNDFEALLNIVIDFIFWIGMALAPVMFIVAGRQSSKNRTGQKNNNIYGYRACRPFACQRAYGSVKISNRSKIKVVIKRFKFYL